MRTFWDPVNNCYVYLLIDQQRNPSQPIQNKNIDHLIPCPTQPLSSPISPNQQQQQPTTSQTSSELNGAQNEDSSQSSSTSQSGPASENDSNTETNSTGPTEKRPRRVEQHLPRNFKFPTSNVYQLDILVQMHIEINFRRISSFGS
jgi:hypothetical protein